MEKITEIPFGLEGQIYRSVMPYGSYDTEGEVIALYKDNNIELIVCLASDDECDEKAGRNLVEVYKDEGLEVIQHPIQDFSLPTDESTFRNVINKVIQEAKNGRNVAVHCSAGIGRTGLFMACMKKLSDGVDGAEAINWVRGFISGAVETDEQRDFVRRF